MGAQQSAAAAVIDKQTEVPEIQRHDVRKDGRVRVVIEGVVYDVTEYLNDHPGGSEVLIANQTGDATAAFIEAGHPDSMREDVKRYRIGRIAADKPINQPIPSTEIAALSSSTSTLAARRIKIIYASQSGQSKALAEWLRGDVQRLIDDASPPSESQLAMVDCVCMSTIDPEDLNKEDVLIFIASTYTDGQPPEKCAFFYKWLIEANADFRIDHKHFLHNVHFACFGCGSSLYESNFNVVAKKISHACIQLGGHRLCADGFADDSVSRDTPGTTDSDFSDWRDRKLLPMLRKQTMSSAEANDSLADVENESDESADEEEEEEEPEDEDDPDRVVDLEELGPSVQAAKRDATTALVPSAPRPMLTDKLRAALSKQHYKLVGSHSGVKLCRWTKAMMRGRGSCYKHCHYGIVSSSCMEATPSLSCANKCVFCWRHSTNPVGKEWKWEVDSPEYILEHILEEHRKMINELRGVPGVQPERLEYSLTPRHCALSLVGEPIMYPQINQLIRLLHRQKISTFLVTNAQFPDQMAALEPVTQLYLSVDASTKEALKAIDRPLFSDFWERFLRCMQILRTKKQRTVFRLTLVKGSNMANVSEYVKLVETARPTLIEIKVSFSLLLIAVLSCYHYLPHQTCILVVFHVILLPLSNPHLLTSFRSCFV